METLNQKQLQWQVAGEWLIQNGPEFECTGEGLPVFVNSVTDGFQNLMEVGTSELPPDIIVWMKDSMTTSEVSSNGFVHSAFSEVFPVSGLPGNVAPNFFPFREVQPPLNPNKKVIVQPVILTAESGPSLYRRESIKSKVLLPPVDPFMIAVLNQGRTDEKISRTERMHLSQLVKSFWKSVSLASAVFPDANKIALLGERRQAATNTFTLLEEGARSISEVARRMVFYAKSQEPSPLSERSRAIILLPWVFKAAEAWMKPISVLAKAGKVEFPGI